MNDSLARDGGLPRSRWTREQAASIERRRGNVAPVAGPPAVDPFPDLHVWDTWLLRDRRGEVAEVNGWRLAFSLTAPADLLPGTRHDVAEVRCFYSADGTAWRDAGPVFDGGALGQRQWAGSALYDDGDLYLYYTAAGREDAAELTYAQRIAVAHGGTVTADESGVEVAGPWTHETLLEPDGEWYETEAQSRGMTYTFRDPWFFEDPATGETRLLFEANVPAPAREGDDAEASHRREFNGCVGVAVSESGDPLSWEIRPPLVEAVEVNQELERPHVVVADGRYYLFVCSHVHTFAPGVTGPDGLYGFVADAFEGPYRPLNGSGLVATNPPDAPFQAYSWMAFAHDGEVLVQSFLNYYDFAGDSLDAVAEFSEAEQRARFGGTLAPTLRLAVDGDETRLLGALDGWRVPTRDESLPPVDETDLPDGVPGGTIRESGTASDYGAASGSEYDAASGSEHDEPLP
ncbi:glycoside hydrolase family 68 protein [Halorubrum sp. BOL3-1]|uniref:glycoside hydrolase family 68 protein n=1 Tax=Halorubrum sp. BOL3-1 TaxID=2497325 RepID=UPI001005077A|nr:glycoside hydrolase family 68 protein [Halorubrum sp. BOL3-1]QAU12281.1 glycoside hydrolase family 68 protein [Halorubrum sp. BOL3-1]